MERDQFIKKIVARSSSSSDGNKFSSAHARPRPNGCVMRHHARNHMRTDRECELHNTHIARTHTDTMAATRTKQVV